MAISSFPCKACGSDNPTAAAFCMICGAPTEAHPSSARTSTGLLQEDQLLKQRYRILTQVGRGGFAAVYKAEDLLFEHRLVAIKEMSQSGMSQQELLEAIESFKREAQLLASLQHSHLPGIYDHFSDGGRWYLVMDFIDGKTLETSLQHKPGQRFSLKETLDIGLQLCSVLEYLHTCDPPIIFRDLKPANILFTPLGHLYLIDFGIARHFKPGQINDTIPFGSPGYAAPEQYGKAQTTQQSDIYSLGVLLHHLLTGLDPSERPFLLSPLRLYGSVGTELAELEKLITSMTDLDPQKRPLRIADVQTELHQIATSSHYVASPPMPEHATPRATSEEDSSQRQLQQRRPTPARFSRRGLLIGGLVTGGALTTAMFFSLNQRMQSQPIHLPSTLFHPNQLPTPMQPTVDMKNTRSIYQGHTDQVWSVAWSPQANIVASAGKDNTIQVWRADTGAVIFSTDLLGVHAVAWSSDGKHLAAINAGNLLLWDIAIGKQILNYPLDIQGAWCMSWTPESTIIAIGGDSGLQLLDSSDTTRVLALDNHGTFNPQNNPRIRHIASGTNACIAWTGENLNSIWYTSRWGLMVFETPGFALAWSPGNNKYLAFGIPSGIVQVVEILKGTYITQYQEHETPVQALAWSPNGKYIASAAEGINTVHVWDTMSGETLTIYQGHSAPVESISWSPNSTLIASASDDKTVHIWNVLP